MGTHQPPLVGGKLVEKPQSRCYPAIRFVVDRHYSKMDIGRR